MAGAADLLVNQILDLADPGRRRCDTDGQLLARWARDRDSRAFAALVARHGSLVWRVGRSVLPQAEDAEDVFQATFLVLARKAAALRKYSTITGWLYQTAYRLALKARTSAACRQRRENQAPTKATADPLEEISAREARTILAEELDRLSASYREPILLCLYQGATQDEAARKLGCSRRTLKRRLERARTLLGQRLTRRGLAPATALALTLYSNSRAPAQLARATIAAATQFASGKAVTGSAALLAQGMLHTWLLKTMAGYLGIVVVLGGLTLAGGWAFLPRERNEWKPNLLLAAQATERPVKGEEEAPRLDVNGDPLPPGALARIGSNRLRHGGSVAAIAYLPDGKSIASSSTDGRLQLWDATTGKLRWHGKSDETRYLPALAVSGDGKKLAMLMSFEYELLATDTGKKLLQHQWPQEKNFDFVCCKAVAPNLETLARGCVDGTIRLHDAVSGKETVRIMVGDKARIRIPLLVAFSTDSKKICVLTRDKAALLVFDTKSGKAAQTLNIGKPLGGPFQLIHSQKHQLLALMDVNEMVVWDLATGKIRCIIENGVRAYSGAFSPDDSFIAIGRGASDIWVFDTATGKERQRLRTYRATQSLAFAPDGKTLASGDHGGAITLWDIPSGKPRFPSPAPKYISHFRFVNQGKEILSFGDNDAVGDSIDWWQVSSGRLLRHKDLMDPGGQRFNRYTLSVSPDAKLLAVDLADLRLVKADFPESKIVLMDCETGATVHTLSEDKAAAVITAFSPDGTLLFTSAAKFGAEGVSNPHVTVWEVATGKLLRKMNTPVAVEKLEVSPNGRWIAGQSYTKGLGDYGISLWEVATGKLVHRLCPYPERTLALVFSADSSRLASVGNTTGRGFHGEVHLWDVVTAKEVRTFTGHEDVVTGVAMTPDDRTLATSSLDNTFRLWEIATGKERGRITGHEGHVGSMDFSPDGSILPAASSDAPIYLWNTYAVQKSKLTGANLTRKEREGLWEKLADDAGEIAFQSICELIAHPSEAVAILEGAWKRLPRATSQQMRKWITDLNNDQFTIRKTATAELERFGADHEALLREALKQPGSLETRQRLEKILGRGNQERLRRGRMLEVLEHLHTEPARRFLRELAEQRDDSTMAREAAAALERLAKLRAATP